MSDSYDWAGLRGWRLLFFAALILFLPGSCFLSLKTYDLTLLPPLPTGLGVSAALVAGALYGLRSWKCPRCGLRFADLPHRPWVTPWTDYCRHCGLAEFTTGETSPKWASESRISAEPLALIEAVVQTSMRRRMQVALVLAIPLLYLTMCRLPAGESVKTESGNEIRFLGATRNKTWSSDRGSSEALEFTYYANPKRPAAETEEVLKMAASLAIPSDTIIELDQVRGDWWLRAIGISITRRRSFRRGPDGNFSAAD